jgi:hypothetical protein
MTNEQIATSVLVKAYARMSPIAKLRMLQDIYDKDAVECHGNLSQVLEPEAEGFTLSRVFFRRIWATLNLREFQDELRRLIPDDQQIRDFCKVSHG